MSTIYKKEFSYSDSYMSGTTSGYYEVEYEITDLTFKFRGRMNLVGNWGIYGTENRYAMYLKVGGVSLFDNYTMKAVSQGSYNFLNATTEWSSWQTITLTEGATSVPIECGVSNTGYATTWSNHQSGWPEYPNDNITFPSVSTKNIYVKVDGAYKKGKAYIKIDGAWKQAKKVFIKNNGSWVESK